MFLQIQREEAFMYSLLVIWATVAIANIQLNIWSKTSQTCCRRMIKTEEKAKDRRWCLADGIYSILCHASYFALEYFEGWIAPGWFEEKDEFILFFKIVLKLTWRPLPFLLYLFYDPKYRVVCVKWLYIYHVVFPSYYHNFIPISHYFL